MAFCFRFRCVSLSPRVNLTPKPPSPLRKMKEKRDHWGRVRNRRRRDAAKSSTTPEKQTGADHLSPESAATYLGLSEQAFFTLWQSGQGPEAVYSDHEVRFRLADLAVFLELEHSDPSRRKLRSAITAGISQQRPFWHRLAKK